MTKSTTGTGSPGTGPATVNAAAAALEALLTAPADNQEEDEANTEGDEEADEVTEEPEDDEADPTAEGESDEDADPEEEEEADEDSDEEPAPPVADDTPFTVTVDGKEETVTLAELRQGYSRTSDYTRKTQALAETRKQFEAEAAAVREERAEYVELLPKLRERLAEGMGPEPDWDALRAQDPAQAAVLWQKREERRRQLDALQKEEAEKRSKLEQERAAIEEEIKVEQRNKLLEKLPSWRDQKVAKTESDQIVSTLRNLGFEDGEIAFHDHRALLLARKAAKYDALMAKKPELEQKRSKAPVARPGGGTPKRATPNQAAQAQLKQKGDIKSAAAVFAGFLN